MQEKNNSNKCVNANEDIHIYTLGNTKFIVRTVNKNIDPEAVLHRLEQIAVNYSDIKN